MKNNNDKTMEEILREQKSKHRDWSDVRAETLPSDKSDIRNELEVK